MISPCDCIVGAHGEIRDGVVYQAKGFPYTLESLLNSSDLISSWEGLLEKGSYVTLRLKSNMYHRFHAPCDSVVRHITYISGDTWNVNPIALSRVRELFCKNERAVIQMESTRGHPFLMVPVAAILVASIRFHALNILLNLRFKGPNEMPCHVKYRKGDEIGWFEHGSTILMFVPKGYRLADQVAQGVFLKMGSTLFVKDNYA
jgi:phosphatidylserine decarboxylase